MATFTESVVEDAALAWLAALGYAVLHGPDIAAGELGGSFGSGMWNISVRIFRLSGTEAELANSRPAN